jgi:DNA topoisomerase-1
MRLLIVESPAKCSKIQSFLGAGWQVMASMGHIRGLVEKLDAVGIDRDWTPLYEEMVTKKDQIAKLKKAAKGADVWLATDDDREGEGIAWHICQILKLDPATTPRIVFHEITKTAIQEAVAQPRRLDMNRVNAQQARAMLDLLVGFTISRVLWKRVAPRLSAGRCQTPALRLVAERDAEIAGHTARNFWRLRGVLAGSQPIEAAGEWAEEECRKFLKPTETTEVVFLSTKERQAISNAPAPLITSTLQQEASALHGLGPKATMAAAQKLYEAGHITYMRTDNAILSAEAAEAIRSQVRETWGEEYVGSEGQHQGGTKVSKGTTPDPQAAHEAIRPTHPELTEVDDMDPVHKTVYRLIWRRAMQSQMAPAKSQVRTAALHVSAIPTLSWSAEQSKPLFEGWRIVERSAKSEESRKAALALWDAWTPTWSPKKTTHWSQLVGEEVFTKPPSRYTEATLIRELEKRGIGRPSTFASLVSTLFDREYVEKTNLEGKVYETRTLLLEPSKTPKETKESHKSGADKNKITATPLGVSVIECLSKDFGDLFAYEFTAGMEGGLDKISEGSKAWKSILQETWDTYKERYATAIAEKDTRQVDVGDTEGTRVVQTKKGPLLVRKKADGTAEFAALPRGITAANVEKLTTEKIEEAFAAAAEAKEGELLGVWSEEEIRKKKGPYGWYVQAGELRVPWKAEDTLETLQAKLEAKRDAFERTVGPYTIKKGPYGFYFYKKVAKGKPRFIGVPKDADPATIPEAELDKAAAEPPKPKRIYKKKE